MDLVVHGGALPTFLLERLLAATGARPAIRARADVAINFGGLDSLLNLLATDQSVGRRRGWGCSYCRKRHSTSRPDFRSRKVFRTSLITVQESSGMLSGKSVSPANGIPMRVR